MRTMRCGICYQLRDGGDMFGSRSATASDDIDQTFIYELFDLSRHCFGCFIILPEAVGQSCIGVGRDVVWCCFCQLFQERFHVSGAERTIQSYR